MSYQERKIIQPKVINHQAFEVWKDKASKACNNTWAVIYKSSETNLSEKRDPESVVFLEKCFTNFYLVIIVENAFIDGNFPNTVKGFID